MKRVSAALLVLAAALFALPGAAVADSAHHTYFLGMEEPNVAEAPNGDRVAVIGEGEFSVNPKGVEAEGEFTHTTSTGSVVASGTWTATELLDYQSYGCGVVFGTPLPPELCGGKVKMRVTLAPEGTSLTLDGILTVFCVIGPNPPNSASEGITLVVPGVINFNKVVEGDNFYFQLS
jgi:hypothetical protein